MQLLNQAETQPIILRRLEVKDIPQLQRLHEDWFPIRYNDSFYNNAGQGLWENGEPLFTQVALFGPNEDIIGAVTAQIQRSEDAEDKQLVQSKDGTLMYILTLGARQDFRRKGIASVLLSACINEAKMAPSCCALYLHVKADNTSAIRFYEKNGFQRVRFLEDYYFINGQNHHAYLYIRYVNGGIAPLKWFDVIARPFTMFVEMWHKLFGDGQLHSSDKAMSIV
ncbi:Aste57867_7717 [Aphanomyces stellatus]|uniref:N-alpha-acetyltransferase 60 n=1 Tax=Aphanomyces stellatus TaxID=120398 RepID=A0A485KIP3_9STRA|nr:hypothetical protein As57867_007688 [Aphanomyces stellatus]VFT84620.1 Aste57867_7717 [Aphanomyces stellatus]